MKRATTIAFLAAMLAPAAALAQGATALPLDKATVTNDVAQRTLMKNQISASIARQIVDACVDFARNQAYVVPPVVEPEWPLPSDAEAVAKAGHAPFAGGYQFDVPREEGGRSRGVVVNGRFLMDRGLLEFLGCSEGGKEHESVVRIEAAVPHAIRIHDRVRYIEAGPETAAGSREHAGRAPREQLLLYRREHVLPATSSARRFSARGDIRADKQVAHAGIVGEHRPSVTDVTDAALRRVNPLPDRSPKKRLPIA